jgi:allantoicase
MTGEIDLASRWLGASVMAASDESFGEKENLLVPSSPVFEPGHYGHRGEIVDGWETRRRRAEPGHDWALIRLGAAGIVTSVEVDTSFFTGNYPPECAIHAYGAEGYPSPAELLGDEAGWAELVPRSSLAGDTSNVFPVTDQRRYTHVRLSAFPDGGIARLRVYGQVIPDPRGLEHLTIDLASQEYGGLVTASSDGFYTSATVLNRPDTARTMGEGWETQRRRDAGHDYAVIKLGLAGQVRQLIVDTAHFKYNASAEIEVYGRAAGSADWEPLLARTRLQPDTRHVLAIAAPGPVESVRIDAFPDGGLSRVRLAGNIDPEARRAAGYRWFNALPSGHAARCLLDEGLDAGFAEEVAGQRPLTGAWLDSVRDARNVGVLARVLEGAGWRMEP